MKPIILASSSIYRKQQLERLNLNFSCASPEVDEAPLKATVKDHRQLSRDLSLLKAQAISANNPNAIVIGGDQVASMDDTILSKPKTAERAFEQLKMLNGKTHQLITSLAIIADGQEYLHSCIANMAMRKLSDAQIKRYIAIDQPLHSCGSYRLEALGISLFDHIDCADYSSIIGIPLMWTARTLDTLGIEVP